MYINILSIKCIYINNNNAISSLSKKVDVSTVNCIKSFSNREIELQLNAEGRTLLFYVDTNSKALVASFRGADGIWKNIVLGTFK